MGRRVGEEADEVKDESFREGACVITKGES